MAKSYRTTDQRGTVVLTLSNTNGQDGVRTLTLPITPEEIQINRPSRQAVTQTLTSAYQDHLGSGISTVVVRGHTGWRDLGALDRNDLGAGTGYEVITNLRNLLADYDNRVARGDPSAVKMILLLNLPNGWEQFRVSKNAAAFSRSRAQPLLYRYEMQFTVLEDLTAEMRQVDPSPNFVITLKNAPSVKLISSSGIGGSSDTTSGSGGSKSGNAIVTSDSDLAAKIAVTQAKRLSRADASDLNTPVSTSEPGLTSGTPSGLTSFGAVLAAIGNGDMTLRDFAEQRYPVSQGYPDNMYLYIIAANPDYFTGTGLAFGQSDPNQIAVKAGNVYRIPVIDPQDAWTNAFTGFEQVRNFLQGNLAFGIDPTPTIDFFLRPTLNPSEISKVPTPTFGWNEF